MLKSNTNKKKKNKNCGQSGPVTVRIRMFFWLKGCYIPIDRSIDVHYNDDSFITSLSNIKTCFLR